LKIQKVAVEIQNNPENKSAEQTQLVQHRSPNFKSGVLGGIGGTMDVIQNGGFLISFLIQDMLGMTLPRVGAAFLRDKEVTGKYNIQEGFEVLGREGLTGPCMMATVPLTFAIIAKLAGKSTGTNSRLIRRYGDSLKEMLANSKFNKALLGDANKFKAEFLEKNVRELLTNTVGKDHVSDKSVKYILEQLANYQKIPTGAELPKNMFGIRTKGGYRKQCLDNITKHIDDIKYRTSNDLDMLGKVNISAKPGETKAFATKEALEGLVKYSDDAIIFNKHLNKLTEIEAENFKNRTIAKRIFANVATMASVLGVLSVLPKIYAKSDIAPGAKTAMELKAAKEAAENTTTSENKDNGEVSFKGRGPAGGGSFFDKISKFFSNIWKDGAAKHLEFDGHNFTSILMTGLSLFGLLAPRGMRAYDRAQVDENGKKDLSELYEILIRDISSSLAVVFAVPMLTRACVTAYEDKTGFVLMNKDRTKTTSQTVLDLLNPMSKAHVMTNAELTSLYGGINSKEKMLNFCEFIEKNNGDLHKILSKSKDSGEIFNKNTFELSSIANLSKKEKNAKITDVIKKLGKDGNLDKAGVDNAISKLMKGTLGDKKNGILKHAKGLNSIPAFLVTFLISPYLLGWFIPRLTYANTRRMHEKAEEERQVKEAQKINTAA